MDDEILTFGPWLQRRRQALRLTQQELCQLASCSVETIRKIESDLRRPSVDVARLLAIALHIPEAEHAAFIRFARSERADAPPIPEIHESDRPRPMQPPSNLPIPPTPLVGREAELADVRGLLLREDVRLVTMTGPGGVGKTRLSLAVAASLRDTFVDGTVWVNLAPLNEPELVLATIAQTLDVKEIAGQPLLQSVQSHLRDRQMLLVLDNFEQVLAAGLVVSDLLAAAHRLRVLVTSREGLHLRGEHEVVVQPLALPGVGVQGVEALTQYDAVRLFVARAQAVKADFQVTNANAPAVAEICVRLDGLPLAVELAAARVKMLAPDTLLQRLSNRLQMLTGGARDLPTRQQTLRNTIDWSYNLLEPVEQTLFVRLAVFVGGWTLEVAEAVCKTGDDLDLDVLDGLQSLINKSLVRQEDVDNTPRFTMLETVRAYALEQLEAGGILKLLSERHAATFLILLETAGPRLGGAEQAVWLQRLDPERNNLRAALAWAVASSHKEMAARFLEYLWFIWYVRGPISEGLQWHERVLSMPGSLPTSLRVKILFGLGSFRLQLGDYVTGRPVVQECLALAREIGDQQRVVWALNDLAGIARTEGDYATARSLFEESMVIARTEGDLQTLGVTVNNLGGLEFAQRNFVAARHFMEQALEITRQCNDIAGEALTHVNLGYLAIHEDGIEESGASLAAGLRIMLDIRYTNGIPSALQGFSMLADRTGNLQRAVRLAAATAALRGREGVIAEPDAQVEFNVLLTKTREALDEQVWQTAWAEGQAMTLEQAVAYAIETPN